MTKPFYLIILFFGFFTTAKSQHCGWDGCHVIIVDVRDSLTNEIIHDLDIVLTDAMGTPYRSNLKLERFKATSIYQPTDTLKFGQNHDNLYPKSDAYQIPFAFDHYLLLVYDNYPGFNENGTDKIFIKDKHGRYKSVATGFAKDKIASMCTGNPIRHNEKELANTTIKIKLIREK